METTKLTKISKFLSLVLRHKPETIALEVDHRGYGSVAVILNSLKIKREELEEVVACNSKKRFEFSEDGRKIRASQGHSFEVDLGYEEKEPPKVLYHGTSTNNLNSIYKTGIRKMKRQHVHLSISKETAQDVGSRHGHPIVIEIQAQKMYEDGHKFYISTNGVWLTDDIPLDYFNGMCCINSLDIGENSQ